MEIDEELEGANDSLNMLDTAALEGLPQLTSSLSKDRRQEVESPVIHSQGIRTDLREKDSSKAGKILAVTNPDVNEKKNIHENVCTNCDNDSEIQSEDLVVLSFSSSAGTVWTSVKF